MAGKRKKKRKVINKIRKENLAFSFFNTFVIKMK